MSNPARILSKKVLMGLVIITGCTFVGCSLFDKKPSAHQRMGQINKQKVFFASYDNVWRAAHAVLKYPIAQENQDTGVIETEYIKGVDGWIPPNEQRPPSSGIRYKLTLIFAKGKTEGRESTRVTIEKRMEILRDFFSEPETMETDGLEEKIIFYRIERELIVNEALKKAGF
ncbi:hypothetical protein [Bdellovibrio bacteriovorus]|uniref:Lipoprotein n=3 Tax=Bdellovibrio bacteriovorus TaxID=959 RepID=Q6MJT4_BDEBA|nr:hypothetical protein [Bdellovibrio bacteriovorus]AFY02286.1 hypothetical protein Bdt_2604 [Bdellovibrio bacteriovorus str. Tiberius]AHZ85186.1 hypothetical protein EP01_09590 [Bdellovibrio bacteriovorus]ASD63128.1 hypothetical protein B9G79_05875 [Bdellovibrio bacteriovorus]CAE80475.1 hypothetical protein predicted by Glimmer/Critica [Bdellovibrio bacteriovorus HD100]BEV69078.1 hypothetical protein Bb109J_c2498 [Bdellovibrio bacteriovorus]